MKNILLYHLRIKFRASTLLETITASIILMIIFVMSMDTLTRIFSYENENLVILVESDLIKHQKSLVSMELTPCARTFTQKWGEIRMNVSPYRAGLFQIDLQAFDTKGKLLSSYCYLQSNP